MADLGTPVGGGGGDDAAPRGDAWGDEGAQDDGGDDVRGDVVHADIADALPRADVRAGGDGDDDGAGSDSESTAGSVSSVSSAGSALDGDAAANGGEAGREGADGGGEGGADAVADDGFNAAAFLVAMEGVRDEQGNLVNIREELARQEEILAEIMNRRREMEEAVDAFENGGLPEAIEPQPLPRRRQFPTMPTRQIHAWPLVHYRVEGHSCIILDVLWPLFRYQRKGREISWYCVPLLLDYNSPNLHTVKLDLLFPLVRVSRYNRNLKIHVRPYVFNLRRSVPDNEFSVAALFHLWHYYVNLHSTRVLLFPLFFYHNNSAAESRTVFFLPGLYHKSTVRSRYMLWPLLGVQHVFGEHMDVSLAYPFVRYRKQLNADYPDSWEVHLLWPLVGYVRINYINERNEVQQSLREYNMLPLFSYSKKMGDSRGWVLGYWWKHESSTNTVSSGFFPLYTRSHQHVAEADGRAEPYTRDTLMYFPFYLRMADNDGVVTWYTPLYCDRWTRGSHLRLFLPLGFARWQTSLHQWRVVAFWFVERHRRKEFTFRMALPWIEFERCGRYKWSLVFPFRWRYENYVNGTTRSFFLPFFTYSNTPKDRGESRMVLPPLLAVVESFDPKTRSTSVSVLWPLVNVFVSIERVSVRVLPLFYATWMYHSRRRVNAVVLARDVIERVHASDSWELESHSFGPTAHEDAAEATREPEPRPLSEGGERKQRVLHELVDNAISQQTERGQWKQTFMMLVPFFVFVWRANMFFFFFSLAFLPPYVWRFETRTADVLHVWPFYGRHSSDLASPYPVHTTIYSVGWPFIRWTWDARITGGSLARRGQRAVWWAVLCIFDYEAMCGTVRWSLFYLFWRQHALVKYRNSNDVVKFSIFPVFRYEHNKRTGMTRWCVFPFVPSKYMFVANVLSFEGAALHAPATVPNREWRLLFKVMRLASSQRAWEIEFNPLFYRRVDYSATREWVSTWTSVCVSLVSWERTPTQSRTHVFCVEL